MTLRGAWVEPIGAHYRVAVDPARLTATIVGDDGAPWFALRLLHAIDTLAGPDETLSVSEVTVIGPPEDRTVRVTASSSIWQSRWTALRCRPDGMTLTGGVVGSGDVLAIHFAGGHRPPFGFLPSGSALRAAFSPNPDHPRRIIRDAVEPATIGVVGSGAEPGVGHWLFTPAPWCFALSRVERTGPLVAGVGDWAYFGLSAPVEEQNFTAVHYLPGPEGFSLRADYEGHTRVDGTFAAPQLDIGFGFGDPYQAVAAHSERLRALRLAPALSELASPRWWSEPMFCGWGAQCAIAARSGGTAPRECTEDNYDTFLTRLGDHGISPGTIVVDDKWADAYATCEPNPAQWPDLRGWIARRHAAGQRVLLWWKAWDVEGADPAGCVRLPDGTPVAVDPGAPTGRRLVQAAVHRMLATDGLDADGLKIDFTATTPSGTALSAVGTRWGAALLHELLATAYRAAKEVKPDALIITHAANPAFADVTDVVRLNDVMMLDSFDPAVDVVSQMTHRARIVTAALPGMPIDTDGWCMPDRQQWRAYAARQPDLGVPALYYAGGLDRSLELMTSDDFDLQRREWARYRAARGRDD